MDIVLQKHKGKRIFNIPDGLDELSADIGREVIRNKPENVYKFICDYLEALIIARENVLVAVKVVDDVAIKSEKFLEVLDKMGLTNKQISAVLPRLQQVFRDYVEAHNSSLLAGGSDEDEDADCVNDSLMWIRRIFQESGSCFDEAKKASFSIQALFFEQLNSVGELNTIRLWKKASVTSSDILRNFGVSRSDASKAALKIQAAYRGYCVRKKLPQKEKKVKKVDQVENLEQWLKMIYEHRGFSRVLKSAKVIQDAWRKFAQMRPKEIPKNSESSDESEKTSLETNSEDLALFDEQRVSKVGFNTIVEIAKDSYLKNERNSD